MTSLRTCARLLLLALVAAFAGACGASSASPLVENVDQATAATGDGDFLALVAEGDAQWDNRGDEAAVQAAIAAWEEAITAATPSDMSRRDALFPVYVKLSMAYYWHAHAHLRWMPDSDDAMMASYDQGKEYAETALALNNDAWTQALLYETPIPDAVATLTADDVPAMYWYATNLGRWGLMRGITTVLANVSDIKAMMDRVEELNPDYFYGAPNRYFGVYYTKLPFGNPDLDQSRARFEANMEAYPQYLETRVLLAEEWAMTTQERAVAEENLQYVVDADVSQWPELEPENANAQRRARQLLEELDEYFR